jgi:GNAT superfamily N-acetyltransferase
MHGCEGGRYDPFMSRAQHADLVIRPATIDDDRTLALFAARLAGFPLPPWRTADEIATADARAMMNAVRAAEQDDDVLIAERDGAPVGCLHMLVAMDFFGRRHAHISVIAVSEAVEGTGVGRALLAHADRWARERALPLVTLNVFAANERARRFYEQSGFAPEIVKYARPVD